MATGTTVSSTSAAGRSLQFNLYCSLLLAEGVYPFANFILSARLPTDPKDYYAALMNIDPESASRLHPSDTRKLQQALLTNLSLKKVDISSERAGVSSNRSVCPRFPPPNSLIFWLDADPVVLRPRLDERVATMVSRGLVRELDEFLVAAAKSLLPGEVAVNPNGSRLFLSPLNDDFSNSEIHFEIVGVSEEAKKAIFQLANEGLLPSTGTEHWCRGVLQSIGFKEFEDYLQLSSVERQSEAGQVMLNTALEQMKTATKQYARRQVCECSILSVKTTLRRMENNGGMEAISF